MGLACLAPMMKVAKVDIAFALSSPWIPFPFFLMVMCAMDDGSFSFQPLFPFSMALLSLEGNLQNLHPGSSHSKARI